jgi:hypothetical protein
MAALEACDNGSFHFGASIEASGRILTRSLQISGYLTESFNRFSFKNKSFHDSRVGNASRDRDQAMPFHRP